MKNIAVYANHIKYYKQTYGSFFIFIAIICVLGLPFTNWGFKTDDWGNIYHCTTQSLNHFFNFFNEGSIEVFNHPSNADPCEQAFFCGLYRPMSFVYYAFQYFFFGNNPYGYFLVLIGFHALSTVVLFNIFSMFAPYILAFLSALYFGFHPSLWNWLGWVSAQTYFIELFILLILILFLKYFIDHHTWWAYLFACTLFLLNLFLREQTVFLPLWIIAATLIYKKSVLKESISFLHCFLYGCFISIGFLFIDIIYIVKRLHQLPLTANTATLTFQPTWQSFITRMIERKYDFVSYISDMIGFSWLPNNHQIIKGALILAIISIAFYFFYKNNNKIILLFLGISVGLFSWPALLMHCQPRYYYMAIPLFIMFIIILLLPSFHIKKIRYIVYSIFLILLFNNAYFLHQQLAKREKTLRHITTVFENLVKNPATKNRALCFINLPLTWFHMGTTQAVWLLREDSQYPVFQYNNEEEFEPKYQHTNPLFITWDYNKKNFVLINTPH